MNPKLPRRKTPAHMSLVETGNRSSIVYLTLCAKDRKRLFDRREAHACLLDAWKEAQLWRVGKYVLMPDHLHLFCSPATFPPIPMRRWITYWKSMATRRWPWANELPIWQADAWDRQLRSGDSYSEKWNYVRENPVREKLCTTPEAWPFQGELSVLQWHDV